MVGKAVGLTCANGLLYMIRDNGEITVRGIFDLKVQHTFMVPGARDIAVASDKTLWVLAQKIIRVKPNTVRPENCCSKVIQRELTG